MTEHVSPQRRSNDVETGAGASETSSARRSSAQPTTTVGAPLGTTVVQTRTAVGAADDPSEREADFVARSVVQALSSRIHPTTLPPTVDHPADLDEDMPSRVRRTSAPPQPRRTPPRIQPMTTIGRDGGEVDGDTDRLLHRSRSSGRPLPDMARSAMESAFGNDFSAVRVHTGSTAAELNHRVQARAFTTGSDIYFRDGLPDVSRRTGQELLAHELTHTIQQAGRIQRRMPTTKEWKKSAGSKGTTEFTQITQALIEYHGSAYHKAGDEGPLKADRRTTEKTPEERIAMVQAILGAIDDWQTTKEQGKKYGPGGKDLSASKRWDGVSNLRSEATEELARLEALSAQRSNPQSAEEVQAAAQEIYSRGMHAAFRFVGLEPNDRSRAEVLGYWKSFRTEAAKLDRKAVRLSGDDAGGETRNADLLTLVVREGMRAFRTVTYSHLGVVKDVPIDDITNPDIIRLSILARIGEVDDDAENAEPTRSSMKTVERQVGQLIGLSGAAKWATGDGADDLDEQDQLNLDLVDSIFTTVDLTFTQTGYIGTAGQGNEGFEENFKPSSDSAPAQNVATAFSAGAPQSAEGQAVVSGSSDIVSALAGYGGDVVAAYNAWKVLNDDASSRKQKAAARMTLVATPASVLANTLKIGGGATHMGEAFSGSAASTFLSGSSGATRATDVKMAGDVAGLFASVLGIVGKLMDFLHSVDDNATDIKAQARPLGTIGGELEGLVGLVNSVSGTMKATAKLAHQIGGDATSKAFAGSQAFPALGLIVSVMDVVHHAQRVHRFRLRRNMIIGHIGDFTPDDASIQKVQALELVADTMTKRLTRAGLDLSRGILQTGAGVANLTGVGTAPGMVISIAASASQVGQLGLREGKKFAREKKATKRSVAGKEEAYEHWEIRKYLETNESGVWAKVGTRLNIAFTPNWDKIKGDKKAQATTGALELLEMNESVVWKALGVEERLANEADHGERIKIVITGLEKR